MCGLLRVHVAIISALTMGSMVSTLASTTEEQDVVSHVQAGIIMHKRPRQVGSAPAVPEEDSEDGIIEEEETMLIQSELCTQKWCPGVDNKIEEAVYDDTSLLQVSQEAVEKQSVNQPADTDEAAFFQTQMTVSKGPRRVGVPMDDEDEEGDDMEDGASFLQATVALEEGDHTACSNGNLNQGLMTSCTRRTGYEEEELDDDVAMM
mmetsp:Transcript_100470/g.174381  ORF Transcript_100470/g.174381 Transcript_100470/m.174381 type:complete len:206 (+) Transcript_100470:88-705(+)